MAQCEVCGNEYHLSFEVIAEGQKHVFDSFECAIYKFALSAPLVAAGSWGTNRSEGRVLPLCSCARPWHHGGHRPV
jgi:hypothetical protein